MKNLPPVPDLQDLSHAEIIFSKADEILSSAKSKNELEELEEKWVKEDRSLFDQLAVKLALSRKIMLDIKQPTNLSVVFAVYKETERMQTREENPLGEDFLIRKIDQLDWLTKGTKAKWELFIVDDGCPDGSGEQAREILIQNARDTQANILFLSDAIQENLSVTEGLETTDDSRKGGSILFGMWYAAQVLKKNHYVIFTDADLSTHLGQSGLLLEPMLSGENTCCIGSRRQPSSVVIKGGSRSDRGRLFIHLWKSMIPTLDSIIDTQCGFKAFRADIVNEIVLGNFEKQFAFDIELLLKLSLHKNGSIAQRGIAWIDSEAASTTKDLQPYLPMLQSIAQMSSHYLPDQREADELIELISDMTEDQWQELLKNIPKKVITEPIEKMGHAGLVNVREIEAVIGSRR